MTPPNRPTLPPRQLLLIYSCAALCLIALAPEHQLTPFAIIGQLTLLTVVAMLRASGALELAQEALRPVLGLLGIPPETVGLMLVRPISGSAALGVGSELIGTYGPDSTVGRTAAVMLGSTETTFYTIAVYFGAASIRRTRYAVPAALCADLAGFFFAALTVRLFFGA